MPNENLEPTIKSTTDARQGVTGHNVRYVLVWSTLAAVVIMAVIYFAAIHGHFA